MSEYSFTDDMLDVRDLIERYEELENDLSTITDLEDEIESLDPDEDKEEIRIAKEELESKKKELEDEQEEFEQLQEILDELKGNGGDEKWRGDWYPVTLINSDYFTEYTKELIVDIGYIQRDRDGGLPWWIEIDWEKTADNCKMDYTSINIGNEEYYYR